MVYCSSIYPNNFLALPIQYNSRVKSKKLHQHGSVRPCRPPSLLWQQTSKTTLGSSENWQSRTGGSNERFEIVYFPNLEDPTLANVSYLLSLPFNMLNDQLSIIYLPLYPELLSRPSRRSRRKHTIKVIIQVVVLEMRSEMLWSTPPLASECINLVFYVSRSLLYSLPFAMFLHSSAPFLHSQTPTSSTRLPTAHVRAWLDLRACCRRSTSTLACRMSLPHNDPVKKMKEELIF